MQAGEAKTKGVGFVNVKSFTRARYGDAGWDAALERMSPADREELMSIIPMGWYSLPLYARLIRVIDGLHGFGDLALVRDLGRFEAEKDLTTIHRVLLRLANPAFIVEKAGEMWRRYHDTGTWTIKRESPTRVSGTLDGWGCVDEALCKEAAAYMARSLELVGARGVVLEHPLCRATGAERCFFLARWR